MKKGRRNRGEDAGMRMKEEDMKGERREDRRVSEW